MASSSTRLLAWYDRHARKLPWRVAPADRRTGMRPDPYRVWLSEVMLQQTTVAAAKPYFEEFLARWPTVVDLAAAPEADVMKVWAGLGYYSRARNLKAAADAVAASGGQLPSSAAGLAELPGIGAYTAAAIAAIAFEEPAVVVDGNVERVIARLFAIETPLPKAKPEIRTRQGALTPLDRPGDYAQAMMDLGAIICTPKRPSCAFCPVSDDCAAHRLGAPERFPVKARTTRRPTRVGKAFVAVRPDGAVLLRRRPPRGLLGGMTEVPTGPWRTTWPGPEEPTPFPADWRPMSVTVVHIFTHFRLELSVFRAAVECNHATPDDHWWSSPGDLPGEALPSVMKKVLEVAVPGAAKWRTRLPSPA